METNEENTTKIKRETCVGAGCLQLIRVIFVGKLESTLKWTISSLGVFPTGSPSRYSDPKGGPPSLWSSVQLYIVDT